MWIEMEIEKSQWENEKSAYLNNMENGWVFLVYFHSFSIWGYFLIALQYRDCTMDFCSFIRLRELIPPITDQCLYIPFLFICMVYVCVRAVPVRLKFLAEKKYKNKIKYGNRLE